MIDIKFIRENKSIVQKSSKNKNIEIDLDHIFRIEDRKKEFALEVQQLREERNRYAKERNIEKGKEVSNILGKKEPILRAIEEELYSELLKIPNIPAPDVKVGKDDNENDVLRKWKEPIVFSFPAKDHLILGEALDIIDVKRAVKVSGARFNYFKNDGVLLEYALLQLALEVLLKEGFVPVIPPVLIKTDVMKGLGYMENDGDKDMFHIPNDNLTLIGTAEHVLVSMHKDEVLEKKDLPRRYFAYSPAFRREAGSYGRDTKGIFRVHQFNKIEMVSFVTEENDDIEHEYLLSIEEKLLQLLDIPYRVVKMCTGDLGFPAARKYDLEAWMPGQNNYREVTSVSTVTDFQSRRLNMKYQDGDDKKYLHVLNGTAFSMNRPIIAILENYQQEDGSIVIPDVLQKYMGKEKIFLKVPR